MATIDFDMRQLEIFSKVVELKSFSKAADAVCLAQASVSERIANLEGTVGIRLLDRLGRKVVPTRAGELLYKHAGLILDMKRTACLELEDFLGTKQGEIRMGGSTIPGEFILPKLLGDFHEKYPAISVRMTVAGTSDIENLIMEGDLELGVVGSKGAHKYLTFHELWSDELVLVIPAQHHWTDKRSISLKDLSKEPFISRVPGSGTLKIIEHYLRAAGSEGIDTFNVVARLGTSTAVKEGIKSGLGVSILSSRALDTEINAGILKIVKIKDLPAITRRFYLIRDKRRTVSPLCRAMLDFLLTTSKV